MNKYLHESLRYSSPTGKLNDSQLIDNINWRCNINAISYKIQQAESDFQKALKDRKMAKLYQQSYNKQAHSGKEYEVFFKKMDSKMRRKSPQQLVQSSLQRLAEIRYSEHTKQERRKVPVVIKKYQKINDQIAELNNDIPVPIQAGRNYHKHKYLSQRSSIERQFQEPPSAPTDESYKMYIQQVKRWESAFSISQKSHQLSIATGESSPDEAALSMSSLHTQRLISNQSRFLSDPSRLQTDASRLQCLSKNPSRLQSDYYPSRLQTDQSRSNILKSKHPSPASKASNQKDFITLQDLVIDRPSLKWQNQAIRKKEDMSPTELMTPPSFIQKNVSKTRITRIDSKSALGEVQVRQIATERSQLLKVDSRLGVCSSAGRLDTHVGEEELPRINQRYNLFT